MTVVDAMRDILRGDATLSALLPGGIFDVPLDPDDSRTADAWLAHPVTNVPHLQPCAVLLEPQEVESTANWRTERAFAVDQWPDLHIYAEIAERARLDAADARAMTILHRTFIGVAEISATAFRGPLLIQDELPGEVWSTLRRFRIQTVRHV